MHSASNRKTKAFVFADFSQYDFVLKQVGLYEFKFEDTTKNHKKDTLEPFIFTVRCVPGFVISLFLPRFSFHDFSIQPSQGPSKALLLNCQMRMAARVFVLLARERKLPFMF